MRLTEGGTPSLAQRLMEPDVRSKLINLQEWQCVKSAFNVISDGSSLLGEHRDGACLIGSESEWLKCKKGCFKTRPPNSSIEVQHTVSAADGVSSPGSSSGSESAEDKTRFRSR